MESGFFGAPCVTKVKRKLFFEKTFFMEADVHVD